MALTYRSLYTSCHYFRNISKPVKWSVDLYYSPVRILANGVCYRSISHRPSNLFEDNLLQNSIRQCSTNKCTQQPPPPPDPSKLGLYQRLKAMYRDYWYVVVPVHLMTSAIWLGSFYYTVRSGVDVMSLLESLGVSEKLLTKLRESGAGHYALTFALYKVASPLRYAVTLGGTTFAIRRLTAMGWIKPVPSKERLKEMIQEKKDNFQDARQHYKSQMKEKRNKVMDEMRRYKQDMKNKVKRS